MIKNIFQQWRTRRRMNKVLREVAMFQWAIDQGWCDERIFDVKRAIDLHSLTK